MADYDHTAKPPYAIPLWCDDNYIYAELPVKDSPPYIIKQSFTEGGLSKMLHLMRDARRKAPPSPTYNFNDRHPKITRATPGEFSEKQRASARDVLRKMKLIT